MTHDGPTSAAQARSSAIGRLLLAGGIVLAGGAAYLFYRAFPSGPAALGGDAIGLATALWVSAMAIAALSAGTLMTSEASLERPYAAILSLSAGVGAATFFFGIALLYLWSEPLVRLVRDGDRGEAWKPLVACTAVVVGLIVMFLGLQSVRGSERQDQSLRRAVYGFNTFLTCFLLFAVFLVANVLSYLKLPANVDMTRAGIYSLSERSKQILAEIDRPTRLYVVMSQPDTDVKSLFTICAEQQPKLQVEYIDPLGDPGRIRALAKTFPQLVDVTQGALLVYGDEKPENSTYIRSTDMVSEDMAPGSREVKRKFMGEVKLMNELTFLMGGKDKPVVYFTQGHGEPDLADRAKRTGLGNIADKLQRRNYEARPIKLDALGVTVPDDCKTLVVAGPKQTLPPGAVEAITAYLQRGGKLVALVDVEANRSDKEYPLTGLEGLLQSFSVEVTRTKLQSLLMGQQQISSPEVALVGIDPAAKDTSLGQPFKGEVFQLFGCRVLRVVPAPPGQSPFVATPLLTTIEGIPTWSEADPQADGIQTIQAMMRDPKAARERISPKQQVVGVMVTETSRGMPGQQPGAEKPKMVVIGDVSFLSNAAGGSRGESAIDFDLFAGVLDWLRDRPATIGVEPRESQTFELNPTVINHVDVLRFLPLLIAVVGVIGLGLGVWIVRRR